MAPQPETSAQRSASLERALEHHRAGRLPEALALYGALLAERPDEVGLLVNHGIASLQAGRTDLAVASLERAVALQPGLAEGHLNLANAFNACGRFEEAAARYRRALDIDPANPAAHNNLGVALQKSNRAREAVASFQAAIAQQPDYTEAQVNLCQAYRVLDDLEAAVAAGQRAIEIGPDRCEAHDCAGSALSRAGRLEDAVAAFRAALSLNPRFAHARTNLAKTYIRLGRPEEALEALAPCLADHPGHTEALATQCVALNELGDRAALDALMNHRELIGRFDIGARFEAGQLAAFNAALAEHVKAHPTLTFEPEKNSTKGGFQSGNLATGPESPTAALQALIGEAVNAYVGQRVGRVQHPFLSRIPTATNLQMWGVVLKSQGHQAPHIHSAAWISGCYYLAVPDAVSQGGEGCPGCIEFGRPHHRLGAKAEPVVTRVQPQEGLMVLFPSFFYHATVPFSADQDRISIAFDVIPCG